MKFQKMFAMVCLPLLLCSCESNKPYEEMTEGEQAAFLIKQNATSVSGNNYEYRMTQGDYVYSLNYYKDKNVFSFSITEPHFTNISYNSLIQTFSWGSIQDSNVCCYYYNYLVKPYYNALYRYVGFARNSDGTVSFPAGINYRWYNIDGTNEQGPDTENDKYAQNGIDQLNKLLVWYHSLSLSGHSCPHLW
jgi:hypothetical protein